MVGLEVEGGRTRKRVTVRFILASEMLRSLAMVVREGSGYVRMCFAELKGMRAHSISQWP